MNQVVPVATSLTLSVKQQVVDNRWLVHAHADNLIQQVHDIMT